MTDLYVSRHAAGQEGWRESLPHHLDVGRLYETGPSVVDLGFAVPMLQTLKLGAVMDFYALPETGLPTEPGNLHTYYPMRQERGAKVWGLTQQQHPSVYVYDDVPQPAATPEHPDAHYMRLSSRRSTNRYDAAAEIDPQRQAEVVGLLYLLAAAFDKERQSAGAARKVGGLLVPRPRRARD